MSVLIIILGTLVTVLLGIGIIGGVVMSAVTVFRLLAGKGTYRGKVASSMKKALISCLCVLNALALLTGGFFAISAYQEHKDEIWSYVEQKSEQDNILPDYMESNQEVNMNENILSDVSKVAGNISPMSVVVLLLVTLVGAVLLIVLCNGGLIAVKKLWNRLFHKKNTEE